MSLYSRSVCAHSLSMCLPVCRGQRGGGIKRQDHPAICSHSIWNGRSRSQTELTLPGVWHMLSDQRQTCLKILHAVPEISSGISPKIQRGGRSERAALQRSVSGGAQVREPYPSLAGNPEAAQVVMMLLEQGLWALSYLYNKCWSQLPTEMAFFLHI